MKSTDNKKAPESWRMRSLIDVNNFRKVNMTTIQQNLLNPNNQPLIIGEFTIRQDDEGRYCINDLHKASGGQDKHKPFNFMRNQQTKDLISEIEGEIMMLKSEHHKAVNTIKGKGLNQGTFVIKELVYFYAMWISAKFHLIVIRAYDSLVMQWKINDRQSISPEQQALLHEIVARRSGGERKIFAEMWARHNRHFKIPRYAELLAIHFPEAVHYLETMELKAKVVIEKQVVKALPYPQEVIQVAQQINQEFKSDRYTSWYVNARDGMLSVMPLPHGFYPAMDMAEFTKRFDSLLDLLYGSDVLQQGRHFLRERNAK